MKTAQEWFKTLPPNLCAAATQATPEKELLRERESLADAIEYSFDWEDTKQGLTFWQTIHESYGYIQDCEDRIGGYSNAVEVAEMVINHIGMYQSLGACPDSLKHDIAHLIQDYIIR